MRHRRAVNKIKNWELKMKKISSLKYLIILSFWIIGVMFITLGQAQAVKIIPPRLVIAPDTKIEYLFIKNNSEENQTFRFGWKHIGMDKEGKIINLDKFGRDKAPGYKAADDLIRFSPRRATLKPGQVQRITFMLRRQPELEAGEYRSHFLVQREPRVQKKDETVEKTPTETSTVSIDVLVSRAIPIYVLQGETDAGLTLLSAKLKKNQNRTKKHQPEHFVHFDVQKTGNRSVIGIADVFCKISGKDVKINKATRAFAVYAEGEFRKEKMAIQMPPSGCPAMKLVIKGHPNDLLAGDILGDMIVKK